MPRLAPPHVRFPAPSSPARRTPRVMGPARVRATASPGATPLVAGPAVKIADSLAAKDPRFQKAIDKLQLSASKMRRHPPAASKAAEAQAAAQGPANEKIAGAKASLVDELREAETAKPQPQSFLTVLRAEIAKAMPKTLGDTEHFMEGEKKQELKGALAGNVSQQKEAASSGMKAAASQPPDPSRVEAKAVTPIPAEASPAPAAIDAAGAMPAPKPDAEVSLQQRKQDASAMLGEAKVTPAQLQKANDPRFTAVLTAKAGVEKHADAAPATYRAAEQKTLTRAVIQSVAEERKGLGQFTQVRGRSANDVKSGQLAAKQRDEQRCKKVADDIEAIYNRTKQGVDDQLARIDGEVSDMFDKGLEAALQKMTAHIDSRMLRWKLVRYGSSLGLMWIKDKLLGLPDEVNVFYEEGRAIFTRELDAAIVGIANHVETRLKEAKAAISAGQAQIRGYVSKLDPDLRAIGQAAERDMAGRFDELRQGVENKKSDLAQSLAQRYKEAHDKAGEQLKAMQEENKGLLVAMKEKLAAVAEALRNFRTRVMSMLKKGQETIELIVADPIQFLKNLLEAVKKGIRQFADKVWTHLAQGFMKWLFSSLADAGITMPADFSFGSILKLVLQVLGLTFDRIRQKIVKLIGERNVMLIEKAFELIKALWDGGPAALWEKVKEFLGDLKQMLLDAIQDWVVTSIVKAAITKLATMFNPVGAIVQAILTIYNTVMFFIERINQILEMVEAIINSVHKIATGAIGDAANWVEQAMARTVPVIIGFLARLLGLTGITEKIVGFIKKIQSKVDQAIDKVIQKIVGGIAKLFGKGGGSDEGAIGLVRAAIVARAQQPIKTVAEAQKLMAQLLSDYKPKGLKTLRLIERKGKEGKVFGVEASASPPTEVGDLVVSTDVVAPEAGKLRYTADGQQRPIRAWGWLAKAKGGRSEAAQERVSGPVNTIMERLGLSIRFDAGHMIGDQYGGSGTEENLVPQERSSNRSYYKSFEGTVAAHVKQSQANELIYADVRAEYPKDPFKDLVDEDTLKKLPENDKLDLAIALQRVPDSIRFAKLGKREADGKEVSLTTPPPFGVRRSMPSLRGMLIGLIGRGIRRARDLFK